MSSRIGKIPGRRSFHAVRAVIAREFLTRVRTKGFILATLLTPLLVAGFFGFLIWVETRDDAAASALAVVDETGALYPLLAPRLEAAGYTPTLVSDEDAEAEVLDARVGDGELVGYLRLGIETLNDGTASYRSSDGLSRLRRIALSGAIVGSVLEVRLGEAPDVAAMLSGSRLRVEVMDGESGDGAEIFALVGSFLLYMSLLLYGGQILRAILEEKSGRIAEIIISSIRPWEFLLGKIVGVGAVGLLQLGIWIGFVLLLVLALLPAVPLAAGVLFASGSLGEILPSPAETAFFVLCFVLGYLMYASVFASVGALNSSESDAQQMMWPVILLVMVPMMTLGPVIQNPDGTIAVWLSQVPFFSPILMFARVVVGTPAPWEVVLSMVLLLGGLLGMAFVAGKIYRVGILMQGKRPTLPEIWKWVRTP